MKFGEKYRIDVKNISNIPSFLDVELKDRRKKNRIGGSKAITYIDFNTGKN